MALARTAVLQANDPKLIHWVAVGGYLEADPAEFAVRLPLCSTGHAHALASSCRFRNLRENRFSGGLSAISVLTLITSLYAPQPLQLLFPATSLEMRVTRLGVERGALPCKRSCTLALPVSFPGVFADGSRPQVVASQRVYRAHDERHIANPASPTVRRAPYCEVLAHSCSTARDRFCRDISNNRLTGSIPSSVSSLRALTRVYEPSPKLAATHLPWPYRLEDDRRRVGRAARRSRLHLLGMVSHDMVSHDMVSGDMVSPPTWYPATSYQRRASAHWQWRCRDVSGNRFEGRVPKFAVSKEDKARYHVCRVLHYHLLESHAQSLIAGAA